MIEIKQILFPTDFSECAGYALKYAVNFAQKYGSNLIVLHVIEVYPYFYDFSFTNVSIPDIERVSEENAKKKLEALVEQEVPDNLSVDKIVIQGKPFLEIIKVAREKDVDLILIGTHGRTGIEHLLIGSTAEKVVRNSPCPVMTIRFPNTEG